MGDKLAFLKKKEMGLPVWAWGLIVAVGLYIVMRHFKNKGASGQANAGIPPDATPQYASPYDTGGGGGGGGLSGSPDATGGATDNSAQLEGIASAIQDTNNGIGSILDYLQTPIDQGFTAPGNQTTPGSEGTNPSATTKINGVNGIHWGGQVFTTRSQFNAWLGARGLSWKTYALRYPAAYAQYLALPSGKPVGTKAKTSPHTAKAGTSHAGKKNTRRNQKTDVVRLGTAPKPRKQATGVLHRPLAFSEFGGAAVTSTSTQKRKTVLTPTPKKTGNVPAPKKEHATTSKPKPAPIAQEAHRHGEPAPHPAHTKPPKKAKAGRKLAV